MNIEIDPEIRKAVSEATEYTYGFTPDTIIQTPKGNFLASATYPQATDEDGFPSLYRTVMCDIPAWAVIVSEDLEEEDTEPSSSI